MEKLTTDDLKKLYYAIDNVHSEVSDLEDKFKASSEVSDFLLELSIIDENDFKENYEQIKETAHKLYMDT